MSLSLKPKHLDRYHAIARLLFKYGRGDLLKDSGLEELTLEETHSSSNGSSVSGRAQVHQAPGEILSRQGEAEDGARPGKATATLAVDTESRDEATAHAAELADDLEAMGPTFVKVGQFLSTRGDLLPPAYIEALARLQDRVEPFRFAEVEVIVSEQLGVRISKAFSWFEERPVAAASLGQVHRAELRSGRVVAVKVQRPGIREQILEDLDALGEIARFVDRHSSLGRRQDFSAMLEEFRTSLLRELDYRQEARNLRRLAENLSSLDRIVVPSPFDDYVTARVLTMEFIQGRKVTALGPLAKLDVDGAPLVEQLCRAYLRQMLVDGFFHADPHPGNVFLTDDCRLALIDLGMVGQLSPSLQEDLLKLLLSISEGSGDDAAAIVLKIGMPLEDADPVAARRRIGDMVMQFQGLHLGEIALGRFLIEAARAASQAGYRMPRELTLVSKTLLNVDEVARRLDPDFDPNAAIRRNASEIMKERMVKSLSPGKLFAGLLEMKEFAERLPRRLNQLIDAVSENRVRIKVDAINEALLMEGLQKIANRITLGLVISAMIVGAALLMRIDTSFRILGYPGIAILFFLIAALSGLMLVANIVLHDLRAEKSKVQGKQKS